MKKKKPIKLSFTIAVIIIELIFLISMITIYYFYQVAENKTQIKNNITSNIKTTESYSREENKRNDETKSTTNKTKKYSLNRVVE